ncbi:hemerythrin domain-containing protein [Streptomyces sp. MMG1121]|uniref:hemerythrin domain-containing protein n=1 Tax=Streptomyces sp. MMG1121 TaxID=1415544 RepID=UPI00099C1789|nr:hemerythrin domain-containing protein [Streptomyces sp. MMG1121]
MRRTCPSTVCPSTVRVWRTCARARGSRAPGGIGPGRLDRLHGGPGGPGGVHGFRGFRGPGVHHAPAFGQDVVARGEADAADAPRPGGPGDQGRRGQDRADAAGPRPAMRTHCLNFCGALKKHHGGEDMAMFPTLAKQFPAFAPALVQLGEEHKVVARMQEGIQQLVDSVVPGVIDPVRLRADLERLANQLESHFRYEEETIVTALNATAPAPDYA